jgi:hypothetical protein
MAVLPVAHFEWQVLRAVKRSRRPPAGRALRLAPTRRTKDGTFLTQMVESGLLARVTGTPDSPFDATYSLTERGEYAAEYGECDRPLTALPTIAPPGSARPARKGRAVAVGK